MTQVLRNPPFRWEAVPVSGEPEAAALYADMTQDCAGRRSSVARASRRYRSAKGGELAVAPAVKPGQLWLVEFPASEPDLLPLEYRVLTTANVVIYDRALASVVARILPRGGYAEPAGLANGAAEAASERCLRFARDGWSVARLVDANSPISERLDGILKISERLLIPGRRSDRTVMVFANDGNGTYEERSAEPDEFSELIDVCRLWGARTLTILFDALDAGAPPRFSAASTNGLAG